MVKKIKKILKNLSEIDLENELLMLKLLLARYEQPESLDIVQLPRVQALRILELAISATERKLAEKRAGPSGPDYLSLIN